MITSYRLSNMLKIEHKEILKKLKEIYKNNEEFRKFFIIKNKKNKTFFILDFDGVGLLMLSLDIDFNSKIDILKEFKNRKPKTLSMDPTASEIEARIKEIDRLEKQIIDLKKEILYNYQFISFKAENKFEAYEKEIEKRNNENLNKI